MFTLYSLPSPLLLSSPQAVAELHERSLLVKQEHEQLLRQNKRSSTREADLKASNKVHTMIEID